MNRAGQRRYGAVTPAQAAALDAAALALGIDTVQLMELAVSRLPGWRGGWSARGRGACMLWPAMAITGATRWWRRASSQAGDVRSPPWWCGSPNGSVRSARRSAPQRAEPAPS